MRSAMVERAQSFLLLLLAGCAVSPATAGGGGDAGDDVTPPVLDSGAQPSPDAGTSAPVVDAGPMGTQWTADGGVVFHVRSANATRLELSLYANPLGTAADLRLPMTPPMTQDGDVWTATVTPAQLAQAGITSTIYYGYRAWGPNWPYVATWTPGATDGFQTDCDSKGNRFNPNKLLLDPYALEISHDPYQIAMADSSVFNAGSNRDKDSGPSAMKGVVLAATQWSTGQKPQRPLAEDIIYEVHVRGLTEGALDAGCPGTYAAAANWAPYLKSLGVTAVELQPVAETQNDTNTDSAPGNYWGYDTLDHFAPDRRYACDQSPGGPTAEFAAMVASFHAQGLKVFLDVVYNHTAETGSDAILSWKGLDNSSYYELDAAGTGYYDNTGLGGNINAANSLTRDWIMASLHHWSDDLGVDGFRFDLASVLGNVCLTSCFRFGTSDPDSVLNRAVSELPGTVLIGEPWAIGSGTYQVGDFPAGWSTWNDQFRDGVKNCQNKLGISALTMGTLADRLNGSPDIYDNNGRGPAASVNYLISHDGLTLNDLFSCDTSNNNQSWPYGPSSGGTTDNLSWDQGGAPAAQAQAARTGLALIMTAAGTPMMEGGDEGLRSLRCNNNPYDLDSVANWLNWPELSAQTEQLLFVQRLLAFRSAHPALRPAKYRTGTDVSGDGLLDIEWFQPDGSQATAGYMSSGSQTFQAFRVDGAAAGDSVHSIFVAYNENSTTQAFTLPAPAPGLHWYVSCDTADPPGAVAGQYCAAAGSETLLHGTSYVSASRSAVILIER